MTRIRLEASGCGTTPGTACEKDKVRQGGHPCPVQVAR